MSDSEGLDTPEFTARQMSWLSGMAESFDTLSASTPATDGPYSAADFVEWLALEQRAVGYQHRGERDRRGARGPRPGRALAVAG